MKKPVKEIWKKIVFDEPVSPNEKLEVSNLGRIKSFKVDKKKGKIRKLDNSNGYLKISVKKVNEKRSSYLIHRLVAQTFLEKENSSQNFIIHINYKRDDNRAKNLKWGTKEEVHIHKLKHRKNRKSKTKDAAIERLEKHDHLNLDPIYGEEKWKFIVFDDQIEKEPRYQISNYGRINSYKVDKVNGALRRPGYINKYQALQLKQITGKNTARYIHKLVAQAFIPQLDKERDLVIHIDYDKFNNHVSNLKWATLIEARRHQRKNPNYEATNKKLTENKVRLIKKKLADPNRKTRIKILAKQFGVSEMQLWRIKTGENWGHVEI